MQEAYQIVRSDRRTIAIQILPDGTVLVRAPRSMSPERIHSFVQKNAAWIESHRPSVKPVAEPFSPEQMKRMELQARSMIPGKVASLAGRMGISYGRITLRWQRTRWGSCSSKGNLNFNCLLVLVPERVLEYVVIHELCHRKHMNHSEAFWAEVSRFCPEYSVCRKWLKEEGWELIRRLPQ